MSNAQLRPADVTRAKPIPVDAQSPKDALGAASADPILEAFAPSSEQPASEHPPLLTPAELAAYLSMSPKALERWRSTGDGPRYIKLSKSTVRYAREDVDEFVRANRKVSTYQ